jgi:hypothetical protein
MVNFGHAMIRWGLPVALAGVLASPSAHAATEQREAESAKQEPPSGTSSASVRPDAPVGQGPAGPVTSPVSRPDTAPQRTEGSRPTSAEPESRPQEEPLVQTVFSSSAYDTVLHEPLRPPLARLTLGGTTTWRRYCARPGVKSCGEYDRKPEEEQLGDTVDYSSSAPYLGFTAELELLPLARRTSAVRGIGALLGYRRGFSSTDVTLLSDAGQSLTREVSATDTVLTAQALYRYFFPLGEAKQLLGYAGLRAGLLTRSFHVDESGRSALMSTHRLFPAVGLEVSVPLLRAVRLEGAGQVFIGSKPGQGFDDEDGALDLEVSHYGTSVSSFGWEAELGVAGELWGPLGYAVRFRLSRYQDTFSGAGTRTGWEAGGVAEETYSSLHWGLTASY